MADTLITDPYVGPRPFEREDSGRFFGRDPEANELLSLIVANRTVVLYAQSGAGKTSLLNAQVISLLEAESFDAWSPTRVQGPVEWTTQVQIPNIYIFNACLAWAGEADVAELAPKTLAGFLAERPQMQDEYGSLKPRVLIFDQFEELFTTYPQRWRDREGFFNQVNNALEADPLLRVVFSMREDYVAQLDPYAILLPKNLRARFRLERMRPNAALLAVRGPLQQTVRAFAPGMAERLVEDLRQVRVESFTGQTMTVIGEFIEPVQLQVVCQNLWRDLPAEVTTITLTHLQEYGDVNQALSQFYERVVQRAVRETAVRENQLRQWFTKELITPAGTRGTVYRGAEMTGGIINEAVQVMENAHLIRGEYRAGSRWYELTHDTLIEPIQVANRHWQEQQRRRLFTALGGFLVVLVVVIIIVSFFLSSEVTATAQQSADVAATGTRAAEVAVAQAATRIAANATGTVVAAATNANVAVLSTQAAAAVTIVAADSGNQSSNPDVLVAQARLLFSTAMADKRLDLLATLFNLEPDRRDQYDEVALELFFGLETSEQLALFTELTNPAVVEPALTAVINGLIVALDSAEDAHDVELLTAMENALEAANTQDVALQEAVDWWRTGREAAAAGQWETAVAAYNQVIEQGSDFPIIRYDRGVAYAQVSQLEAALTDFDQALALAEQYTAQIIATGGKSGSPYLGAAQTKLRIGPRICADASLHAQFQLDHDKFPNLSAVNVPTGQEFTFTAWPTEYRQINQYFGANPENYAQLDFPGHEGIDIRAPTGSSVFAVADGIVSQVNSDPSGQRYGIFVRLEHRVDCQVYTTTYTHLQEASVEVGQSVKAGDLIALADNTGDSFGSHLHLMLQLEGAEFGGYPSGIIDPTPFLVPLLGWVEPPGPYVEGWAYSAGLLVVNNLAQAGSGGINLRTTPATNGQLITLVPEGTIIIVAGEQQGQYTPVKVPAAILEGGAAETAGEAEEVEGWAFTAYLLRIDNEVRAGQYGINLRQAPNRDSPNIGLISGGSIVTVTGATVGEYTPVRVSLNAFTGPVNPSVPTPTSVVPVVVGQTLFGLHAATDPGPFAEADFAEFKAAKPTLIKVLSYHDSDSIARLAKEHPDAQWMVRTWVDLNGRNLSPSQYLQDTIADTRRILEVLEGKDVVIELHSEPNLTAAGLGSSWTDGATFAIWWLELLSYYRQALPDVRFIYPALSPGTAVSGVRQDDLQFLEASRIAVEAADGLGTHIVWSNSSPMAAALEKHDDYIERFPNQAIWVTEASNNQSGLSAARRAEQYLEFWGELQERPTVQGVIFFVVSSSSKDFASQVWVGNNIGQRVGNR